MEYLNRIELTGIVGHCRFKQNPDGKMSANFQLATDYGYKDENNTRTIERTWHIIDAKESDKIPSELFGSIDKDMVVHVIGRIRNLKLIDPKGESHIFNEIVASELEVFENYGMNVQTKKSKYESRW